MTNPSPKERVLAFVRSKNPHTMRSKNVSKHGGKIKKILALHIEGMSLRAIGRECGGMSPSNVKWHIENLPSMGLQELLIATDTINAQIDVSSRLNSGGRIAILFLTKDNKRIGHVEYEITKNLHDQDEETFFKPISKLIP